MKYLSVCSGIEAATSAWHHMGWEPVAFSEIEPFPSAVLKHHYPNVPNLGDMTKFKEWKLGSIDLLVGGTPCQSFSVAGLRKGLDDPRGNLMLTFGAIARHFAPRWLVWENVPGVLSSNGGRDFGTFLGMLGELGYGFAYRVLDAQYFGVAQRRRRVFVVGCLGNWRAAAAVLFELASMSGNPPPSREKGQGVTPGSPPGPQYGGSNAECADTVTSKWAKGSGGPSGNEGGLFVAQAIPFGVSEQQNVGHCLRAGASKADKHESTTYVAQPVGLPEVMSTLLSSTAGVSRPGNAATEHETYIPMCFQQNTRDEVRYMNGDGQIAGALAAEAGMKQQNYLVQPVTYDLFNVTAPVNRQSRTPGDPCHTLAKANAEHAAVVQPIAYNIAPGKGKLKDDIHVTDGKVTKTLDASGSNPEMHQGGSAIIQPIAFSSNMSVPDCQVDVSPTLKLGGHGGGNPPAIAVDLYNQTVDGDTAAILTEACGGTNTSGPKVMQSVGIDYEFNAHGVDGPTGPLLKGSPTGGGHPLPAVMQSMAVRRLTPRECERLQGFPDDHTLIPWRGKDASLCPDGPRYKALGNSMAVPVMAWIGERIRMVCELQK